MSLPVVSTMTAEEVREWMDIFTGVKEPPAHAGYNRKVDPAVCRAMRDAGKSVFEIAAYFGVTKAAIYNHLRDSSAPARPEPTPARQEGACPGSLRLARGYRGNEAKPEGRCPSCERWLPVAWNGADPETGWRTIVAHEGVTANARNG